jgi:hypothetical protein
MTRVLIDACVLYPTLVREIVLELAGTGWFTPLWSPRILSEWEHVCARRSPGDLPATRVEIARLTAQWPAAAVAVEATTEARLWLPDPGDVHVLAAAVDGGADELLTFNLRDFPSPALAAEGIIRRDPDGFLREALESMPDLAGIVAAAQRRMESRMGRSFAQRSLLKRARLPRLAKALGP